MKTLAELQTSYWPKLKKAKGKEKKELLKKLRKEEVETPLGIAFESISKKTRNLSEKNSILILKQGGKEDIYWWFKQRKEKGRTVKTGEKSFGIFLPCFHENDKGKDELGGFRMVHVFARKQTEIIEK